jgi:hypothetical protein
MRFRGARDNTLIWWIVVIIAAVVIALAAWYLFIA